jgi:hypothetical protein
VEAWSRDTGAFVGRIVPSQVRYVAGALHGIKECSRTPGMPRVGLELGEHCSVHFRTHMRRIRFWGLYIPGALLGRGKCSCTTSESLKAGLSRIQRLLIHPSRFRFQIPGPCPHSTLRRTPAPNQVPQRAQQPLKLVIPTSRLRCTSVRCGGRLMPSLVAGFRYGVS